MGRQGAVIAERFQVGERIGAGGMGVVYRARDRHTAETAAVKIMNDHGSATVERFGAEARILAELSHPAIVRHLHHGTTEDGYPYLAMEWLEGEDLGHRLKRKALSLEETMALARRAAEALSAAHDAGVVHRDVKPGNLFLVDGEPSRLKVLDFGVARAAGASRALTKTGAIVGTVGYLAPEQAQNAKDVDARADVFALGCVLYECLTAQAAFPGAHPVAVLAKLLLEEPPRVRQTRNDVPAAVDALVERMMQKDRAERPADARVLLAELEAVGEVRGRPPEPALAEAGVTAAERRMVSAILVQSPAVGDDATLSPAAVEEERQRVRAAVEPYGGQPTALGNGATVVLLGGTGAATDRADRAASCALALRETVPESQIALATGRAQTGERTPVGPALDAAASILEGRAGAVRIDEVTAGLLDPRFEVSDGELRGERAKPAGVRKLLGKPTPLVGRRKELRLLRDTLEECIDESAAQALLVTAPAGVGKSRLMHAFLREVGSGDVPITVLRARGQPVGADSPLALARQLVRSVADIGADASEGDYRSVRAHVEELDIADPPRVADFLAELAGAPNPDKGTPQLRAARNEPRIMTEWLQRSFTEWLGAEAANQPVLVVLEDLHWGDAATASMLESALLEHAALPLMVLGFARPDVHDALPKLLSAVELQEVSLRGLSRRAIEQLAAAVLGDDANADLVARIAEQSQGNAFYVEELLRHAAEGGEQLPPTVLAMVEARLVTLEPEARQILRAASVYGEVFWQGGVQTLLGRESSALDTAGWLGSLVDRELLEPSPTSRYEAEPEYTFRHALVREAVYATLADDDRRTAHALAGDWLERHGEPDPNILIEHFEAGGASERCRTHYLKAARAALEGGDLARAIALSERGLDAGASGELRGLLLVTCAQALGHMQQWDRVAEVNEDAVELLRPGSNDHAMALALSTYAAARIGDLDLAQRALQHLSAIKTPLPATRPTALALTVFHAGLLDLGQHEMTVQMLTWLEELVQRSEGDPSVQTWALLSRHTDLVIRQDDLAGGLVLHDASRTANESGDLVAAAIALVYRFLYAAEVGRFGWPSGCEERRITHAGRFAGDLLAWAALTSDLQRGRIPSARAHAKRLAATGDNRDGAVGVAALAECDAIEGRTSEAETRLAGYLKEPPLTNQGQVAILTAAGRVALRAGWLEAGLSRLDEGWHVAQSGTAVPHQRSRLLRLRAEALLALRREKQAREVISFAYERMRRLHDSCPEHYRDSYLNNLDFNRRIAELAQEHLPADAIREGR